MNWLNEHIDALSSYIFAEWDEGVLLCGDCMDIMPGMPEGCVDIAITSPPYNQLGKNRSRAKGWSSSAGMFSSNKWHRRVREGEMYEDQMDEGEYQEWLNGIVHEMLRCSKGLVWLNHKTRYRKNVGIHPLRFIDAPLYAEIIWDRGGSMALNCKRHAPSHEAIYGFGMRHYWDDSQNKLMSVWKLAPSVDDDHPCSFPIEIPSRLITASCPPGGIVLDIFIGVGKTGVAAIQTGRYFVACEISEKYCTIAEKRINEALEEKAFEERQLVMFEEETCNEMD